MIEVRKPYTIDTPRFILKRWLWIPVVLLLAIPIAAQPMRPSDPYRNASTDRHEIVIQKNGRVDVYGLGGLPMFSNIQPGIAFDSAQDMKDMDTDGRFSTRQQFRDPLGVGQELYFEKSGYMWSIRVYPLQPFITVRCAYRNTRKKNVEVRGLMPWVGANRSNTGIPLVFLGPESLAFGADAQQATPFAQRVNLTSASAYTFDDLMMARDTETGRFIVMAYLDRNDPSRTSSFRNHVQLSTYDEDEDFRTFVAGSVPARPITLAPGEAIESPTFYIALSDNDPFEALERLGEATALWNGSRANAIAHAWSDSGAISNEDAWSVLGFSAIETTQLDPGNAPNRPPYWSWAPESFVSGENWVGDGMSVKTLHRLQSRSESRGWQVVTKKPLLADSIADAVVFDLDSDTSARERLAESFFYSPKAMRPILVDTLNGDIARTRSLLTLAAFSGGKIRLPSSASNSDVILAEIKRGVDSEIPRGVPVDMFTENPGKLWVSQMKTKLGAVWYVGIFHSEESGTRRVPLSGLTGDLNRIVTVYDVWNEEYLGTAQGSIDIEVPKNGVRLLSLQVANGDPTVLSASDRIDAGLQNVESVVWNPATGIFSGTTTIEGGKTPQLIHMPLGTRVAISGSGPTRSVIGFLSTSPGNPTIEIELEPGVNEWEVKLVP